LALFGRRFAERAEGLVIAGVQKPAQQQTGRGGSRRSPPSMLTLMQIKAIYPALGSCFVSPPQNFRRLFNHAYALHGENCSQTSTDGRRAHWRFGFYYGRFASRRPIAIVE
jgi:hypothetical protein